MKALNKLMANQGWMIHDLVDGDQIDNQEERKLLKLTEQAAQELAALRSEIANYETARQEDARRLEQVKGELDALLANDAQSVDEFNAGYQAYEQAMDLDTAEQMYYSVIPDNVPHYDSFETGYAWAKFTAERAAALKDAK